MSTLSQQELNSTRRLQQVEVRLVISVNAFFWCTVLCVLRNQNSASLYLLLLCVLACNTGNPLSFPCRSGRFTKQRPGPDAQLYKNIVPNKHNFSSYLTQNDSLFPVLLLLKRLCAVEKGLSVYSSPYTTLLPVLRCRA